MDGKSDIKIINHEFGEVGIKFSVLYEKYDV